MTEHKLIMAGLDGDRTWGLADYESRGGYSALKRILPRRFLRRP